MGSFGEGMNDVLGLVGYVDGQYQQGVERKRKNSLADLMGQAASGGPVDHAGIQRNGGDAFAVQGNVDKMQDRELQEVGQMAAYLHRMDPAQRAQAYPSMLPRMQAFAAKRGLPPPPGAWDEAHLGELSNLSQYALAGDGVGNRVQSTYVDGQGNRYAIMRDGSQRMLGRDEPNVQLVDTANGWNAVDKTTATAQPVTVGQGGPQAPMPQGAPPANAPGSSDSVMAAMNYMVQQGMDPAKVEEWGMAQLGGQAEAPPPPAGPVLQTGIKPAEAERLRIAQEASARADAARADAADAARLAREKAERDRLGNPGAGYRMKPDGTAELIPGVDPSRNRLPTAEQNLAAGFYDRMVGAERELDAVVASGYEAGSLRDAKTAGKGDVLNYFASDSGQQYRQAQEDWVRSKLRKESGAAIPAEEMEREIRTYFPQPGDSEKVKEQKRRSRETAVSAMHRNAARALQYDGREQPATAPSAPRRLKFNPATGRIE